MTTIKGRKMFIGGRWIEKETTMNVHDPQDNTLITTVPRADEEDMVLAIHAAKKVTDKVPLPVHERMRILNRAADYVASYEDLFAITIASEGSKTITEARSEVKRCVETLRLSAEEARRIHGETIPFDQMPGHENRIGYYYKFPVGIIGAITPFNDPLNLVAHKIGPAIASGNAIIVKPATLTPISALLLAEAFETAELPAGMLSVVTGSGGEIGDTLVTHPAVRMISFTGGLETGKAISHKAGLKKLGMELGSNSPAIVLKDADVVAAAKSCTAGAFGAVGQNCIGVQRIFVETEVYDSFKKELVSRTKRVKMGDKKLETTEMGPLISEKEAIRVEHTVAEAVARGATVLAGGTRNGAFYAPTVLADVPVDAPIAMEEIFGPVVLLFKVDSLKEAIEHANAVNYGLQAGIFTHHTPHAFQAIQQLDVGGVMVNESSDYRIDGMPFGGVKGSGLGREGVRFSIEEMTEPKVVQFKL